MQKLLSRSIVVVAASWFACVAVPAACAADPVEAKPTKTKPAASSWTQLFDGKTLEGWRIVDQFDFEDHGKVEVKDGAIIIGAGKPASGISWTKKHPKIDYEISLEAQRVDGDDFFCGLTFPVNDSYCSWIVGGWGGRIVGLSNLDDASAVENETTTDYEFQSKRWYKLRIRVTSDRITAWIDNKEIINAEIAGRQLEIWWEQEPSRPLGVVAWKTASALRDFKIRQLTKEEVAAAKVSK